MNYNKKVSIACILAFVLIFSAINVVAQDINESNLGEHQEYGNDSEPHRDGPKKSKPWNEDDGNNGLDEKYMDIDDYPPIPPPPDGKGSPYISKTVFDPTTHQWVKKTTISPGEIVKFKIVLTAQRKLRHIKVEDWLPMEIVFLNATPNPTSIVSFPPFPPIPPKHPPKYFYTYIVWDFGSLTLNIGEHLIINLVGRVTDECYSSCVPQHSVKNFAKITAKGYSGGCNNPITVSGSDSCTVIIPCIYNKDLTIQKKVKKVPCNWAEHTTVNVGDNVEFRIKITNTGNTALDDVLVRDVLPTELTYISATPTPYSVSGNTITWHTNLAIGETKYFYVTAQTNTPTQLTTNWAYADYDCYIHKQDSATVTINEVDGDSRIEISKKIYNGNSWVDEIKTSFGATLRFNISVTNKVEGSSAVFNLTIIDYIPGILEYIENSSTLEPSYISSDGKVLMWNVNWLQFNHTLSIEFEARVIGCGTGIIVACNRVNVTAKRLLRKYSLC
jgi:uncharacterized repeat protein (TIGR01451 family)